MLSLFKLHILNHSDMLNFKKNLTLINGNQTKEISKIKKK